jgi:hypothetical protein
VIMVALRFQSPCQIFRPANFWHLSIGSQSSQRRACSRQANAQISATGWGRNEVEFALSKPPKRL